MLCMLIVLHIIIDSPLVKGPHFHYTYAPGLLISLGDPNDINIHIFSKSPSSISSVPGSLYKEHVSLSVDIMLYYQLWVHIH